jgi:eukaryotic-like serine/threonine-protein kinase
LGRYTLGERLGVGGMGEVYLAIQTGLGGFEKPLALKLLLPHLAERPSTVKRFLEEAQVAAKMNHVNVAQIFDVGAERGRYFIAMELVRGVSLSALVKALKLAQRQLPAEVIAYVARSICDGLHHAHALGVVHRDVTPHNVLVSVDGAVKLTDFGIALVGSDASPGKVEGKAAYIAPELVLGGAFDHRSDLFSLGVSLYQLATLESPFRRDDDSRSLEAVTRDPWTPLSVVRPDLPAALVQAIEKASAKDPAARFADARAMRDALPPPHADAADHLAKLVQALCSKDIDTLDARTKVLGTAASSPATASLPEERPRSRGPWLAAAAAAVLVVGAGLYAAWPRAAFVPPPIDLPQPPPIAVVTPEVQAAPAAAAPLAYEGRGRAKKAIGTGYVSIDAKPWAEVRVDGKLVGETPIAKYPVEADGKSHEVELRNPETKRTVKRTVKLADGQHTFVRADLK